MTVIVPPGRRHSKELTQVVGKKRLSSIKPLNIERALLPERVKNEAGQVVAVRPRSYIPPRIHSQDENTPAT